MLKFLKNLDLRTVFGVSFFLWVVVFIQSKIEGWMYWDDAHWYNLIMLAPGGLLLLWSGIRMILGFFAKK